MPTTTADEAQKYTLDELRSKLSEKRAQFDEMVDGVAGAYTDEGAEGADVTIDLKGAVGDAQRIAEDMATLQTLIEAKTNVEAIDRWADADAVRSVALAAAANADAFMQSKDAQVITLGEAFTASPEFKAFVESGAKEMGTPFVVEASLLAGAMFTKDVHTGSVSGVTTRGFGRMERDPFAPAGQRVSRVRDLFPARPTTSNLIEFFRVTGYTNDVVTGVTNAASTVAEYSSGLVSKPQTSLEFTSHSAAIRTIAHWEYAHRNALADEPQLQGIINDELLYGLRLREDQQILSGAGTGEDLPGILNDADIQTQSGASILRTDALRKAITKVMLAYWAPTGMVLHPNDWEAIELDKVNAGTDDRYLYVASVADGARPVMWALPVVPTPAITAGTALVGAFGLGAQLYDREQATIRIADQHGSTFVQNAVTVLAEQRVGLAIKRPESFCSVTGLGT